MRKRLLPFLFLPCMSLYFASLNSGSNGNCYYIGNENEAVLVDAGISCREIQKRMNRLGLDMGKIKAIFISHEHTDHTRGVATLSKKFRLPVYITKTTLLFSGLWLEKEFISDLQLSTEMRIGDLRIIAFSKTHDAADPSSFTISCCGTTVGVFTDIGKVCDEVKNQFKKCHAAFLESNYDTKMLEEGGYPWHLKQRIRGGKGHLSNTEALHLFRESASPHLSHLLLSHLSQNNNCPKLVQQVFEPYAKNTNVVVASRYQESQVYQVNGTAKVRRQLLVPKNAPQLELFG